MKFIIILVLITCSNLHAGTIIPDISWKNTSFNKSGAAAAMNSRKSLTTIYTESSESGDDDDTSTYISAVGYYHTNDFSAEVWAEEDTTVQKNNSTSYINYLDVNLGSMVTKDLALGFSARHNTSGANNEINTLGLSSIAKLKNNIYLGGKISSTNSVSNDSNLNTFIFGVGYLDKKDMSAEVFLTKRPSIEYVSDKTSDDLTGLTANLIKTFNNIQFVGEFYHQIIVDSDNDYEITDTTVLAGIEYELDPSIIIGVNLRNNTYIYEYSSSSDSDFNYDYNSVRLGLLGRYITKPIQIDMTIYQKERKWQYNDNRDDKDITDSTVSLAGTVHF